MDKKGGGKGEFFVRRGNMQDIVLDQLLNYGILGVIAIVFFKDYYDGKKEAIKAEERRIIRETESEKVRLDHEKALAVVLSQSTTVVTENQAIIKDTKRMHEDMDMAIERIELKIDDLTEKISQDNAKQLEVITTLQWIKDTLRSLGEE